jgi:branched-chain amino acid transport system substrate-binding protein
MRNWRRKLARLFLAGMVALALVGLVSATGTGSSEAQQGAIQNCPQAGKWAIAVWDGDDGTDAEQAFATCGEGAVAVAYSIDRDTQLWSRWFADRPEISNLTALNNMQGVMVLGGTHAPTAPSTPTPSPTFSPTATLTPAAAAAGGAPTDYLDTFHAALEMSIEMDIFEMDFAIEGDFEAPGSCSCDISASMWGIPIIEQRVIVIDNTAWIDTGDGWHETTPSDPEVVETVGMCPACPSFWEDAAVEPPSLPGEHETKNSVPAIHYTLAELYEGLAGIGLIPEEMEGVSIETFDIWLAKDGKWLVCLDMEICVEAEAIEEEIGMPVDEIDSVCIEMSINITDANDTGIQVNAPLPGASGPSAQQEAMQNCPQPGKWAIAVWDGDDGTDASEAFATCGEGAVTVAYSIDPDTQLWSRWFAGRPEISNLTALNNMQGVMALGGTEAPAPGPLKIGILVPFTGALSDFGEPFANAAKLAVKEINEAGGVLDQDVVLVLGDSATEPVKAQQETRRLVDIEKVSAIIGAAASGVTLPVAQSVAVPSEIVQISPSSTSPALTAVYDNDYLFRTTISDAAQGLILAHLADDLGFTSACTMYVNNAYGQGLSQQFAETLEELGGTVTAQVSHATEEQVTYLLELNWCVEGNPDVLVALSYPEHGRVYLKEALEVGLIDTFLFVDGTKSDTMFEALGWHDFEGMYGTAPGSLEVAAGTTFDNAYEAEYGEKPPVPFMRETYDAVYVIAVAAAKASSTDSTAIRNALRDIANPPGQMVDPGVDGFKSALTLIAARTDIDYQGAAGPIDFDPNGDVLQGAIEIWQISGGRIVDAVRTFAVDLSTTPPTVTEVTE